LRFYQGIIEYFRHFVNILLGKFIYQQVEILSRNN